MSGPPLDADEFGTFFAQIHGVEPFPWQRRLAQAVAETGCWPDVLSLPTGCGKTAVLDVATFHLALEADRGCGRRAPVRIALVVDRRLIVDDSFARAERVVRALEEASPSTPAGRVAARLRLLAGDGPPLLARRLRGGMPRENDWARTPSQPTILCSTVDQVGSRLLFRGYGVSDRAKPIHAGLLGSDCHLFLDEAHLAEPFRQTLDWIRHYQGPGWRMERHAPWGASLLTATPRSDIQGVPPQGRVFFELEDDDHLDPVLRRRWVASKPVHLVAVGSGIGGGQRSAEAEREAQLQSGLAAEVLAGYAFLERQGLTNPALAVVVNRVARARRLFDRLRAELHDRMDAVLLIGPARPVDRAEVVRSLDPIRTGRPRGLQRPLLIVATQCLEAGVDLDLDGLVSEVAPVDALRQRFGRLNRDGRPLTPWGAVVAHAAQVRAGAEDSVYGPVLPAAWRYLQETQPDFGLQALGAGRSVPQEAYSPTAAAPVLMPAHVDLLPRTSPVPSADVDVALHLHGPQRQPASVAVVWRADIEVDDPATRGILTLMPPRVEEAVALPVWTVRAWLNLDLGALDRLADVAALNPGDDGGPAAGRRAFRWAGDDERSAWVGPDAIRPGDTIVVPSAYGGVDGFGWNLGRDVPAPWVPDAADRAAAPHAARRFALRVAPGLLHEAAPTVPDGDEDTAPASDLRARGDRERRLREVLAAGAAAPWRGLRDALLDIGLPAAMDEALQRLDLARGRVEVDAEAYGGGGDGPRGVVFVVRLGLRVHDPGAGVDEGEASTEDDASGSWPGFVSTLDAHTSAVEAMAERFARLSGLPETRVADLRLAAFLHDLGKADPRFQRLLAAGDPLGPDPDQILAKSARRWRSQRRNGSGLPLGWRHEALSVRMAALHPRFVAETAEPGRDGDLVLWLIGTHHGWGRPFFPHADPLDGAPRTFTPGLGAPAIELPPGPGPNSLAYDRRGLDWAGLQAELEGRYGMWELARLEAVLRLADHRASEAAAAAAGGGERG